MFATDLTVTITNSSLGLVAALIVSTDLWALPLLLVPLLTVFLAYRAYVAERQRGERLEFLYEANRTLSRSPEIAEALEGLLARSLDAFRAERAEIILWTPDKPPLRTTLGPGDHKEVMQPSRRRRRGRPAVARLARPARRHAPRRRPREAVAALPARARRAAGDARDDARRGPRDRHADARQPPRRGPRLLRRRPEAVRDAGQQRRASRSSTTGSSRRSRQLRDLQEQLRHQAYHDALTDLPNRSLFIAGVRDALAAALRATLAVLFIDVDDFKTVNDTLGHAVGDELLVAVAAAPARLRAARATRSRGSAATSSPCACTTPTTPRRPPRWSPSASCEALPAADRGRRRADLRPPQRRHRLRATRARPTRTS